ncbi:DUF2141 domain-containing protein [Vibrio sp. 10N.261.55.A7]|uniref:DUF2141 domain-containing protein n=1 Tax=Vibrio sp. 10N.261.55.A7 TaxID=1880851 RepID=UPI000CAA29C2|nr:DUF2141 domain-containing protein [Vibrio sp. 10N.261.55.A7]PMJ95710.1 hypothetical protein BCU12_05000 [Vibrio sp. 10N.261.55.A7]
MNWKLACLGVLLMSKTTGAISSEITVTGIEHKRGGNIIVFIFTDDGFPKQHDRAVHQQTLKAQSETMQFHFEVNEEEVAIKVLHDEDENGRVTKNWTGIYPAEGLGFSNKQKVTLTGAPVYKRSKINASELGSGLSIEMVYP